MERQIKQQRAHGVRVLLAGALVCLCAVLLGGCTFTRAWFQSDYLGRKVTAEQALSDINDYIRHDSNSNARKDAMIFMKKTDVPMVGESWWNNDEIMLWFEKDSITGKIKSICMIYPNSNTGAIRSASVLTAQICEIIDPWDYVFSADNRKNMLSHMDISGSDMQIRVFANNNDTRVEKFACNAIGFPISMMRFSKMDDQPLEDYAADLFLKSFASLFTEGLATPSGNPPQSAAPSIPSPAPRTPSPGKPQGTATAQSELSFGGITIGDSKNEVYTVLGREQKTSTPFDPKFVWHEYPDITVVIHDGAVSGFISNSARFQTKRGIREGSTLQEVKRAYGNEYAFSQYGGEDLYEYKFTAPKGQPCLIRFSIKNGAVDYISARYLRE